MKLIRETGNALNDSRLNDDKSHVTGMHISTSEFYKRIKQSLGQPLTAEILETLIESCSILNYRLSPPPFCNVCGKELSAHERSSSNPMEWGNFCDEHKAFEGFINLDLAMADAGIEHGPCYFRINYISGIGGIYQDGTPEDVKARHPMYFGRHHWIIKTTDGKFIRNR